MAVKFSDIFAETYGLIRLTPTMFIYKRGGFALLFIFGDKLKIIFITDKKANDIRHSKNQKTLLRMMIDQRVFNAHKRKIIFSTHDKIVFPSLTTNDYPSITLEYGDPTIFDRIAAAIKAR